MTEETEGGPVREAVPAEVQEVHPASEATEKEPHIELDGNAEGGWIAQVHTGDVAYVFTSMAKTPEAAKTEVLRLYAKAKKEADGASRAA
jgi:hypothetical protein